MFSFVKKGLYCALLVGGLSVIGAGVANAAEAPDTSGAAGMLAGTQAVADATVPVTVTGNAISVLGDSTSSDTTTAPATADTATATPDGATTDGSDSILAGTQAVADATVPVTVTGNAISVLGDSTSSDTTTAPATADTATPVGANTDGTDSTNGSDSTLGGTQAAVDATVPVTVSGNAIFVIGDSSATGNTSTVPGTPVKPVDPTAPVTPENLITTVTPVTSGGTVSPAPTGSNSAAASTRTASATVAGFLPTALAATGAHPALLLGIALVPVAAGALLLILLAGLRRRQALQAWPVSGS